MGEKFFKKIFGNFLKKILEKKGVFLFWGGAQNKKKKFFKKGNWEFF
ncbi:MAG: hypothetical protein H0A76_04335 [Candidatus Thiodubiliella endoseptemdiera]|uniref:Uncharacterized protein n=1 Tax=Candidatus Thiodubiliella endoseptemdiera TaxID=2738886 RepID=A0A853F100_9GAMM|nr:hypothetical protein [Candidatus Thiodubiliella endoseptemdiera]